MAKEDNINVLLEVLQRAGLICQAGPAGARHGNATSALQSATPVSTAPEFEASQSAIGSHDRAISPSPRQSPAASPSPQNYTLPGTQAPATHADVRNTWTDAEPEPVAAAAVIPPPATMASPGLALKQHRPACARPRPCTTSWPCYFPDERLCDEAPARPVSRDRAGAGKPGVGSSSEVQPAR